MTIVDDLVLFPEVPSRTFDWAPLMIEPMQGSGERFVFAVVATDGGDSVVHNAISGKVLHCMYGDSAATMAGLIDHAVESMEDHLAEGIPLADWESPFGGCFLGQVRKTHASSASSAALLGAQLVASLMRPTTGTAKEVATQRKEKLDVDVWVAQIRERVLAQTLDWRERFNREVVLRDGTLPTRFGYVGKNMAAGFEVLDPGYFSMRRQRAKSRLLDLQLLRDSESLLPRASYELMLWIPSRAVKNVKGFESSAKAVLLELEEFGDRHDMRVVGVASADEAAARIVSSEAA